MDLVFWCKVLFVHAADFFTSLPTENVLTEEGARRIVAAYRDFEDQERFRRVVSLDEVADNDHNLNISRYVDTLKPVEPIDIQGDLDHLKAAERARDEAAEKMNRLIRELGYSV